ncbi:unnamed protein product [Closterium sp. Naga37s-1]|nr:unnamed protein product [Closterium sp. Naga37s-1]
MSGGPAGGVGGGGTSRDGAQMHPDMAFEWGYSPRAVHSPSRFSRDEEANPNRTKSNLSQQRTLSLSAARLSQAAADLGFHVTPPPYPSASANAPPAAQAGAFPGFSPAAAAAAAAALAAGGDAGGGLGLGGGIPGGGISGGGLVRGGSGLPGWSGGGVAGAGGAGHLQSLTVDPSKAGISSRGAGGHGVPPLPLPSPKGNAAAAAAVANAAAGKLGSPRGNFSGSRAAGLGHWPRAGLPASIQQQLMLGAIGGGAGGGAAGGGAAGLAGLGGMQSGFAGGGGGMGALGNVGGAGMAGMAGIGGMAGLAALNSSSDGSGSGGGSGGGLPGMNLQTQLSLLAAQLDGRMDDNNPLSRTNSAPPLGALLASIGDVAELERLYRLLPDAMSPDVSPHVGLTLPYQGIGAASGSATSSAVGSVATSPDRELHLHRLLGSMGSGSMGSMGSGSMGMGSGSMAGYLSSTVPSMAALIRERTKLSRTSSCPPPVAEDMSGGAGGSGMEGRGGEGESSESEGESGQHGAGAGHKRKKRRAPGGVGAGADVAGRSGGGGKQREPEDALDGGARLGGRGGGGGGGGSAGSGGKGSAGAWGGSPGGGYSMQGGGMGGSMQAGAMETSSQDYIHVRARRGQATDSHSLAERVRREKISDRMKVLQSLVPTCTKATGKAVMLDEIINYVRSLQLQVELLSAKLAAIEQDTAEMDGSDSPADFCAAQMAALGGLLLPSAPASAAAAGAGGGATGGGGNVAAMGGGAAAGGASAGAGVSGGSAGSAGAAAVAATALAGGSTASPMATPSPSASLGAAAALHPDMASLPTDLARLLLSRHLPHPAFGGTAGGGGTGGGGVGGEEMGGGGGGMGGGGGGMGGGGGGMGGGGGEGLGELTMEQLQAQLDAMNGVGAGGGGEGQGWGGRGGGEGGLPHMGVPCEVRWGMQCEWDGGLESIVAAAAAMPPSQQAQSGSGASHSANNHHASGSSLSSRYYRDMRDSLRARLSALYGEARRRLPAVLASAQVASACFAVVLLAWVNAAVRQMWPELRKASTEMLKSSLRGLFEGYHFGIITGIDVRSVDLGPDPPTITAVRVRSGGADNGGAKREAQSGRAGQEEGSAQGDVDVQVSSIAAAATLKLTLKPLLPRLPGFGAVLLSLLNQCAAVVVSFNCILCMLPAPLSSTLPSSIPTSIPPSSRSPFPHLSPGQPFFDFKVSVMGGNLKAMPGFEKMIETVLRLSIDDSLVWPSRWVYPVVDGDFSFLELTPVGYLDVSLIEAEGLPKTDVLTGAADPFVLLYVRQREGGIKRSSTVHHSRHPTWNEGFILEVEDPQAQQLTIRLMDSERFEKSEFIGAHMLPLHTEVREVAKPSRESASTHGRVHVVVMYVPYTERERGEGGVPYTQMEKRSMDDDFPPMLDVPGFGIQLPGRTAEDSNLNFLTDSGTANFGHVAVGRGGLRVPDQQQQQDNSLRLADLRKVELLGRGASAAVYLVQHARTGQQYALKDMQLNMDADVQKHVGNELRINHQCRSPHVVRCYQAFVDDGHLFIVLEYMDAGSLADVLQLVGRITEPYLAAISRQALQGLRDLYQGHRIIHRDIKPSNMLLNQSGCLKISDFGVSRVLENSYDVGNTFAGTYTYMSPERIMGRSYSHNSDLWAFGLSLLECAIGQYPYRPASGGSFNYFDLLSEISNSPAPIAPPDFFSPQFCDFVALCLQKDPNQRPSAEQLLNHPFIHLHPDVSLQPLVSSD